MAKSDQFFNYGGAAYNPDEEVYYKAYGKIGKCRMADLPKHNPDYKDSDMASNYAPNPEDLHIRDYARRDSAIAQAELNGVYKTCAEQDEAIEISANFQIFVITCFILAIVILWLAWA